MTTSVRQALLETRATLARGGLKEATLEADLLVALALGLDRSGLYASLGERFPEGCQGTLEALVQRRLLREPLAYILGKKEFFGLELQVRPGVFIPRPETETLVEVVIALVKLRFPGSRAMIADVGTGSGAVAVSLARALPPAYLYATDISQEALATAQLNATVHEVGSRIAFLPGDLLEPLPGPVDVVAANLPYVKRERIPRLDPEISRFEPHQALDGGPDGLDPVRRLLRQSPSRLKESGCLVLEMDPEQMDEASTAAKAVYPEAQLRCVQDLSGRERVLVISTGAGLALHPRFTDA